MNLNNLKILGIIPARGGSKRLVNKNIKELGGKHLIEWTIESAINSEIFCDILISTDSKEVSSIAKKYDVLLPWMRPSNLATDESKIVDVLRHAVNWYQKEITMVDGVFLLQPTSPFRKMSTIIEASRLFNENNKKMVVSFTKSESKPFWSFIKNKENKMEALFPKKLNLRSQDLPKTYEVNGLVYLISPEDLLKQKTFFSESIVPQVTLDKREAIDIDYLEDFKEAENLLSKD